MGARIADREARVAEFLAKSGDPHGKGLEVQPLELTEGGSRLAQHSVVEDASERSLEAAVVRVSRYAVGGFQLLLLATAAFLVYEFRQQLFCGASVWAQPPCLAFLGHHVAGHMIEVSELQLGNLGGLKVAGGLCINIHTGTGVEMQTRAVTCPDGDPGISALAFRETFKVRISRIASPCVFSVCDQSGRLVHVAIPAFRFADMACRLQEYFRLDLPLDSQRWYGKPDSTANEQPYIAMRLRELHP